MRVWKKCPYMLFYNNTLFTSVCYMNQLKWEIVIFPLRTTVGETLTG